MDFQKYVGIEYCASNEFGNGLSCWELVELVMREQFRLTPPKVEFKGSSQEAKPVFIRELKNWQEVKSGQEKAGDLVLFNMLNIYSHCGIVVKEKTMLHVIENRNATIERYDTHGWKNRIIGFYRWLK